MKGVDNERSRQLVARTSGVAQGLRSLGSTDSCAAIVFGEKKFCWRCLDCWRKLATTNWSNS